jgi:hypothetical protein
METLDYAVRDVMQVCRNGHVITDLYYTFPDRARSHCDRCGAVTMIQCLTCGEELPGSVFVAQSLPIGEHKPPQFCARCGAGFPWAKKPQQATAAPPIAVLENMLRRLPRMARQFRSRHGDRPPFCVKDECDLEDILRAVLALQFDDVRLEKRSPVYASANRTDFWLNPSSIAVTVKKSTADLRDRELTEQIREDIRYYMDTNRKMLVPYVYDPESLLVDPAGLERKWAGLSDTLAVIPVIAAI